MHIQTLSLSVSLCDMVWLCPHPNLILNCSSHNHERDPVKGNWIMGVGFSRAVLVTVNKSHENWWFYKGQCPCTCSLACCHVRHAFAPPLPSAMIVRPPQSLGTVSPLNLFLFINYLTSGRSLLAVWEQTNTVWFLFLQNFYRISISWMTLFLVSLCYRFLIFVSTYFILCLMIWDIRGMWYMCSIQLTMLFSDPSNGFLSLPQR